jgi:hypothetical protein
VRPLFDHYKTAADELVAAANLYKEHKPEEALKSIEKAERDYPEWDVPHQQTRALKIDIAFNHQDYDQFLSLAEDDFNAEPKSPLRAAQLASAFACKYAVTGDSQFLADSQKFLDQARQLSTTNEAQASFQEYAERIEHRLKSREIIDKPEYDKRYRPNQTRGARPMIIIPGFLIALVTFPGVIIHEAAHLLFFRLTGLAVFAVCFFQLKNPAGYVVHEQTDDFHKTFLANMGPFFINTFLCILFCSAAFLPIWELKIDDYLGYFFYWLGISIGMHGFSSAQDLSHIWKLASRDVKKGNLLAIVSYPIVVILYPLNFPRIVWADLGYGIAVGVLAPLAIFKALT